MLRISNTLSGEKQSFTTQKLNQVLMYVCGVTPYDASHIGHARAYVSFDMLYRLLTLFGYKVTYCRNFTDIDDKLLIRAEKELGDQARYQEIASHMIDQFHKEMRALNCLSPQHEPRVTEHIPHIIAFIQKLIDKGVAYRSNGNVYFSINAFPAYTKLSKQKIDELRAGVRKDVEHDKRDPLDFALWKSEPEGTFWKSPWGYGRPGWHIECSALADHYLGDTIDIHGGGLDLIFPHHENEIAQSEALHEKPFARYWVHNGLVKVDKQKMSKSLGNFIALEALFKEYDPILLRYYFLLHHYRAPLDFTMSDFEASKKSYGKLVRLFQQCDPVPVDIVKIKKYPIIDRMMEFLQDDLNTPGMFGALFEHLDNLENDPEQCGMAKSLLQNVLGLPLQPLKEKEVELTPEIKALIAEREKARSDKNWARADQIRDELVALGVDIQDQKR